MTWLYDKGTLTPCQKVDSDQQLPNGFCWVKISGNILPKPKFLVVDRKQDAIPLIDSDIAYLSAVKSNIQAEK